MLLNTTIKDVQTGGLVNKGQFTIAANAQAFKILSDGLYANKIQAIIRELSCNAFDAHVEAGKSEVPFLIKLPNTIEPWFSIRDYGTGLSHDDVMHLYTTYFQSTKTKSNDYTGCLGLGSKSPFSYRDQFTVTSWIGGKKRIYAAFIGEDGSPQIALAKETASNDPNGMEIQVSVNEGDFSNFERETAKILGRFKTTPKVVGVTDFKIQKIEYQLKGTNWGIRESNYSRSGDPYAIQGNVAYPIDSDAIKNLSKEEKLVLSLPIDIDFNLGDLMITASRESLSYGDKEPTTANIKAACAKILAELPKTYQHEFDNCTTYWSALARFRELLGSYSNVPYGIRELARSGKLSVKWKGQDLNADSIEIPIADFQDTTKVTELKIMQFEHSNRSGRRPRARTFNPEYDGFWHFHPDNDIEFLFDDVGRGAHSRIINYIERNKDTKNKHIMLIKTSNINHVAKLKQMLGNPSISKVSALPKPAASPTVNRGPGVKIHVFTGKGRTNRDDWTSTTLNFDQPGIYVAINRYKVMAGDKFDKEVTSFKNMLRLAKELKVIDWEVTPIYGVYPRYAKKLKNNKKWTSLWDFISAKLDAIVKAENLNQKIADRNKSQSFNDFPGLFRRYYLFDGKLSKITDPNSTLLKFATVYDWSKKQIGHNDRIEKVVALSNEINSVKNYRIQLPEPTYDVTAMWKTVMDKYPMFTLLTDRYHDGNESNVLKTIIDYVNIMDTI